MNCTRIEKFLPLYVTGDLTGRRARAVESHVSACERCRRAADEYRASRELFCANTLAPDFDDAFYDEIRNSVLARIRRDRTLAPPAPYGFARFFNAPLAYAASLAALLLVAAALAFHVLAPRTSEEGARREMTATVNDAQKMTATVDDVREMTATVDGERQAIPPPTPAPRPATLNATTTPMTAPGNNDRTGARPPREVAGGTTRGREQRALKSSLPTRPDANGESAPGLPPTPSRAGRNSRAQTAAALVARTNNARVRHGTGVGGNVAASAAAPEFSRIEIQTSDPNIRIIWLSPGTEDAVRPLK